MAIGVVLLREVAPLHVWALRGTSEVPLAKVHLDAVNEATLHQALREPSFWLPDASFTFFSFAAAALWAPLMPAFAAKSRTEVQTLAVAVWFGPAQMLGRFLRLWLGQAVPPRTLTFLGGLPVCLPMSLPIFCLGRSHGSLVVVCAAVRRCHWLGHHRARQLGARLLRPRPREPPQRCHGSHFIDGPGGQGGSTFGHRLTADRAAGDRALLLVFSSVGVASLVAFATAERQQRMALVAKGF